jgi:hypothetical protein
METHKVFCSACDRDVNVVITDEPSQDGHANLHDAEVVCLEIGERCTGNLCPIGATSPTVMAARLVHNGLQTVMHPLVSLACDNCYRVTSHVLIDRRFATCTECGATVERAFESRT